MSDTIHERDLLIRATSFRDELPPAKFTISDIVRGGLRARRRRRTVRAVAGVGGAVAVTAVVFALPAGTAPSPAPTRLTVQPAASQTPTVSPPPCAASRHPQLLTPSGEVAAAVRAVESAESCVILRR